MIFTETEVANLSPSAVLLGQPFENPTTMRLRGEGLADASIITVIAGSAMALTGVAVAGWEKVHNGQPSGNGAEIAKTASR